ncbi:MAG: NAD(P)/FAD-dependent oxidoreductase, partial [Novosphingobium sp.]|nr:NAD(P)/FAD-dependent oxidoreductase [Novosphingobium sp.]
VYEKQDAVGGTWAINRYPDIRVDTPSITYEYSFEKRYPWSEHFGRGAHVRQYLEDVAKKYGLADNTRLSHALAEARFDEANNRWDLAFDTPEGRKTAQASVVISASGAFTNPNFPKFKGQENFKGTVVHPARWPEDLDLTGKRVGVIGNGSTGVQLLGAVAGQAEQVYVFQRTPQWISPRAGYGKPMEEETAWLVRNFPGYWNWWRYMATAALFDIHDLQLTDPEWQAKGGKINPGNDELRAFLTEYIKQETGGRQDLIDKLIPDYAPFSRRPVVDHNWYRTLTRDNVELVTAPIVRMVENGIETEDGQVRELDVLIAATGYAMTEYLMPSRYTGTDGQDLHETWNSGDGPRAYIGMMMPGFPNMFMLFGPNSMPMSGGTGLPQWYMVWSSYIGQCLMKMLREHKDRIEVKEGAYERYNRDLDAEASRMIQLTKEGGMDHNYYVNRKHARLQVNAPWQSPDYHRMCTVVNWDDLELS